jgi:molecular chaperone DnaJ
VQKDYYKILGIAISATSGQIKKAYRQLAMKYHPDRNPDNEDWANQKIKEVNEAFSVLGDLEKKQQYDRFGDTDNNFFDRAFTGDRFSDSRFGLFNDIYGSLFGSSGCGGSSCKRGFGGRRFTRSDEFVSDRPQADDITCEVSIDEQAALTGSQELVINGKKLWFKIPAGVTTGSNIRLRGAREYIDGVPGDLIVTIM